LEGEHSPGGSAAGRLHDHRCHAVDHAAVEHRGTAGEGHERCDAVDAVAVSADVAASALPPFHGPCALARAPLLLADTGVRLGAARGISMGGITDNRNR